MPSARFGESRTPEREGQESQGSRQASAGAAFGFSHGLLVSGRS
jgi:hypothetical protein